MDDRIVERIMDIFLDYEFIDDNERNSTLREKVDGNTYVLEVDLRNLLNDLKDETQSFSNSSR